MTRKPSAVLWWLLVCGLLLMMGWVSACGDPDYCNNDNDCTGGKVCVQKKCGTLPANDAGTEKVVEPTPEKRAEPPAPDDSIKPEPSAPDVTAPDVSKEPDGTRKEGDLCDPRKLAYFYDRCAPGLACAETAQTTPSSGAPHPYGVCLKACSKTDSTCASGTKCVETLDTKTRQPTGIFVCAKEADEGQECVNTQACKDGLTCFRYGTTGTLWLCQQDCTKDASVCGAGYRCEVRAAGSSDKICRKLEKQDAYCNDTISCEDGSVCHEGNRYGAYQRYCRKECTADASCGTGERCAPISINGQPAGKACLKVAKAGEECNGGRACESGATCIDLSAGYARCFKTCTSSAACKSGETCAQASNSNRTQVCKESVPPGETPNNLGSCGNNSLAVRLSSSSNSGMCLPRCTGITGQPDNTLCGKLTPGRLFGVISHPSLGFLTVGQWGVMGTSSNDGIDYARQPLPTKDNLYGVAKSTDGKVILIVGANGLVLRSADSGGTWDVISSGTTESLWGISFSGDGKTVLAVGEKGTIVRSDDAGATWAKITSGIPSNAGTLRSVTFARDSGSGSATPYALAVGDGGLVLRSEDTGSTWSSVSAGITVNLNAVAAQRDNAATGLTALLVGPQGKLWTSTDEGKTWTEETITETNNLNGAALSGASAFVVGGKGTLWSYDGSKWAKATTNTTIDLEAAVIEGQKWVAVGSLGTAIGSSDGKAWRASTISRGRCVGLQSGGAVCLLTCDGTRGGADCPSTSAQCGTINLGGQPTRVCFPGVSRAGTAGKGEACSQYPGAPVSLRCKANHSCAFAGNGYACVQRCTTDGKLKCDGSDTCVFSNTLLSNFCGSTVDAGKDCNVTKGLFCKEGHRCQPVGGTDRFTCQPVVIANETELCDNSTKPCKEGLVCTGLGSTPYRFFCTKTCNPSAPAGQSGCDTGWDCLSTGSSGICVERCTSSNHQCKVKHVRCQAVTASGNRHCI